MNSDYQLSETNQSNASCKHGYTWTMQEEYTAIFKGEIKINLLSQE